MDIEQVKNIKLNFIVSTGRTGSSLLSSMLNGHPNVVSILEETFSYTLYPKYGKVKNWTSKTIQKFCYDFYLFSDGMLEVQFGTKRDLETILENYKSVLTFDMAIKLTHLCFFPNKDKSKVNTVIGKQLKFHTYLGKVHNIYPKSKYIILYRDPRDNAVIKWQMFKNKKQYNNQNYYVIASTWKYIYGKLNFFKNKIGENQFLEVKYEDLIINPEAELKRICSFIDVPYDSTMLNYDEHNKNELILNDTKLSTATKNNLQIFHSGLTQKLNSAKIGLWKQGLKPEEANLIWTVCGDLAKKLGYTQDENFIRRNPKFSDYISFIPYYLKKVLIIELYDLTPFFIKYAIKKAKYVKHFKINAMTSKEFYERTYYAK